MCIGP